MTGHEVRHAQMYCAISEAILKTYGWVTFDVREEIVAHAIQQVVLEQAYHEDYVRGCATNSGYTPEHVTDMITKLHAPIGDVA